MLLQRSTILDGVTRPETLSRFLKAMERQGVDRLDSFTGSF